LKVLFLQDHAETGGAARAAGRLATGLRKLGVEVAVVAGDRDIGPAFFQVTGKPVRGWGRVRELFQTEDSRKRGRENRADLAWEKVILSFRPDLIWIHNIEGAFKWGWSLRLVEQALQAAPVFWTLHDMWALGDGPSYFPERELKKRWSHSPLAKLETAMQKGRCTILTPSVWLRDLVGSFYTGSCEAWPNPLDVDLFHPKARAQTRRELGLKEDEILLLAAAENLADPRKGIDLLQEAWNHLRSQAGVHLGLIGRNCPQELQGDPKVLEFGVVAEEEKMAGLMSAADVFVHPAQVESYGLVLEEAQACGTPVVAFAGGGIHETLEKGRTGWLLGERSASSLASCLKDILSRLQELRNLRDGCRNFMEQKHGQNAFESTWSKMTSCLEVRTKRPHG
jgi:glycosyltransferase involved in cell wall biosynthesis